MREIETNTFFLEGCKVDDSKVVVEMKVPVKKKESNHKYQWVGTYFSQLFCFLLFEV